VEKQVKLVESLSEDGSLKQLNIKCSIDDNILDLVSTITTFGSVAIECKVWGSTTDIICAYLLFSVLRTAVCEPVSMATDPNVVIVDTKSKILFSTKYQIEVEDVFSVLMVRCYLQTIIIRNLLS
jgi:hypothetical protein